MIVLKVKYLTYPISNGDYLTCFFSTITHNLEPKGQGSRFPLIMNEFFYGKLLFGNLDKASEELIQIRKELSLHSPDKVIWDIEDLSLKPPWGDDISDGITDLSNYFSTSDGRDLFDVISLAIKDAKYFKSDILIESI